MSFTMAFASISIIVHQQSFLPVQVDIMSAAILEQKLQEFYGSADTARKRELEAELVAFKSSPDAWQHAWHFLEAPSPSPYLQWFCAMVLEVSKAQTYYANLYIITHPFLHSHYYYYYTGCSSKKMAYHGTSNTRSTSSLPSTLPDGFL